MLIGIVMIALSFVGFYYVRKTNLEEVVVEDKPHSRLYLYLGIFSIIGDL